MRALAAAATIFAAIAAPATAQVRIDGSSTVYPIAMEVVRRADLEGVEVNFSGTNAGFEMFCEGQLEIGAASRPINQKELTRCEAAGVSFIEMPIGIDAITFVVHPSNTWVDHLTLDELRRIWEPEAEGVVMRWSDVRDGWPDAPLVLFGRGKDSGTYDYFTGSVVGEVRESRSDYYASEDMDELARLIAAEPNALGFFGIGGYIEHNEVLLDVAINAGNGPVYPGIRAVQAGNYAPLTRPLLFYVKAEAVEREDVGAFVEASLEGLPRWLVFTGYMPMKAEDYAASRERWEQRVTGTAFGGSTAYPLPIDPEEPGEPALSGD